jgi:hypothetical protein
MNPDPLIDDIRQVRRKISAEHGHDPHRLVRYYIDLSQRLKAEGRYRFVERSLRQEPEPALHEEPTDYGTHGDEIR